MLLEFLCIFILQRLLGRRQERAERVIYEVELQLVPVAYFI